ncbi:hypothetical protein [Herbaspirillum seropedicae]|uniref:hypothetical protein n=1 Tax=Herbaspirillum seropedicae TaxID=964 RepID=UPI00086385F2|nr:hypothetical protein [Herbaspirillum seropedicae]AON55809.1 hypothetical protein Hsc_3543 [Herbaspirillum seropedicae]
MIQFLRVLLGRTWALSFKRAKEANDALSEKIHWVAEVISGPPEFERRAGAAAKDLGQFELAGMEAQIHVESIPPKHLEEKFPGLGQWLTARHFAIFEILFFVGSPALPFLKKVAFGPYDWSQGNAIEILCRIAAQDANQHEIVSSLSMAAPTLRHEALMYALGPLKARASHDDAIRQVIDQLITQPEFREAYQELAV